MKGLGVLCVVFTILFLAASFTFGVIAMWVADPQVGSNLGGTAVLVLLPACAFGWGAVTLLDPVKK